MIYTVTFNPSLDYIVSMSGFAMGMTNRTVGEQIFPGGKGINVSIVLKNLGIENTALGFTAGFTGRKIEEEMRKMGVRTDFIPLDSGFSRINVKLKDYDGTEINGMGPEIAQEDMGKLYARLDRLQAGDVLVLAGSIPRGISDSVYGGIMERLKGRGILFVVDAAEALLLNVLEYGPFLIKPNSHELGKIFGVKLRAREEAVPYARKLQEKGAANVLVSMAGQGAVMVDEKGEVHAREAPKGKLVNAVGAGDSMVAGFLAGWSGKRDYEHAFRMGLSSGSASAFSERLAVREEIERVFAGLSES
ncbi:MAG: 1-phosphofructokinase [Blautia sp.]|nr:1-phosphofructokinase [Blautia sp.]MCM1202460.1 1-phosphofructokinase [Bacteroides fragilis]